MRLKALQEEHFILKEGRIRLLGDNRENYGFFVETKQVVGMLL